MLFNSRPIFVVYHDVSRGLLTNVLPVLQASAWLDANMDQRFGPFSECAKQHVAVKRQKGDQHSLHRYAS